MLDTPAARPIDASATAAEVMRHGFATVPGSALQPLADTDWAGFAASWHDLAPDTFMADGGTYRRRRFACFSLAGETITAKPPQPHFQMTAHNPLNGGVARVFAPVYDSVAFHPVTVALIDWCGRVFGAVRPAPAWHVEMHQFRIAARPGEVGQPTPEGMHRDGVDFVLVTMIGRTNVSGGVTTVADADGMTVAETTLAAPLDSCILDDRRMRHGVSAVRPVDGGSPAFRDVLVLTFRAEER